MFKTGLGWWQPEPAAFVQGKGFDRLQGEYSSLTKFIESSGKPFLPFATKDAFAEAYTNFYKSMGL